MIPIPTTISPPIYPSVFYFFLFTSPLLVMPSIWASASYSPPTAVRLTMIGSLSAVLIASYVFIQWRCSSWAIGFWGALGARCVQLESGCVNFTLVYIFPLLLIYHIRFFIIALRSLIRGRGHAQVATLDLAKRSLPPGYPYEEVKRMLLAGIVPGPND